MLTKDQILSHVTRRTKTIPSDVFGGDLCVREHTRAEYRAIAQSADKGKDESGQALIDTDRWNGGLFANAVIDAATGAPLFTVDEVLTFPERSAVWGEVRRIAQESLDLSEVGPEALSKSDIEADQG